MYIITPHVGSQYPVLGHFSSCWFKSSLFQCRVLKNSTVLSCADCGMGRHKGGGSCACECPPGSSGASCEHFLEASLFAACEKNETATVHVKWGGAQNKGAFAAFYKEGETQTFTLDSSGRTTQMTDVVFEPLCGINQKWANPRWPTACRSFGSVDIKTPAEAGEYGLYVVPYIKDVGTPQPLKDEYKVTVLHETPSSLLLLSLLPPPSLPPPSSFLSFLLLPPSPFPPSSILSFPSSSACS
jgi:hypothetical protein